MIRNITVGYGIQISGNNSSGTPYIDMSRPSAGMIRYNNNNLEVYDGSTWLIMQSSYPHVELNGVAQEAIHWVQQKMIEEKRLLELAKKHESLADALAAVAKAQEQVKIVAALVQE